MATRSEKALASTASTGGSFSSRRRPSNALLITCTLLVTTLATFLILPAVLPLHTPPLFRALLSYGRLLSGVLLLVILLASLCHALSLRARRAAARKGSYNVRSTSLPCLVLDCLAAQCTRMACSCVARITAFVQVTLELSPAGSPEPPSVDTAAQTSCSLSFQSTPWQSPKAATRPPGPDTYPSHDIEAQQAATRPSMQPFGSPLAFSSADSTHEAASSGLSSVLSVYQVFDHAVAKPANLRGAAGEPRAGKQARPGRGPGLNFPTPASQAPLRSTAEAAAVPEVVLDLGCDRVDAPLLPVGESAPQATTPLRLQQLCSPFFAWPALSAGADEAAGLSSAPAAAALARASACIPAGRSMARTRAEMLREFSGKQSLEG